LALHLLLEVCQEQLALLGLIFFMLILHFCLLCVSAQGRRGESNDRFSSDLFSMASHRLPFQMRNFGLVCCRARAIELQRRRKDFLCSLITRQFAVEQRHQHKPVSES
jgi:hypothetical protein